ncbi:hypothetical protein ACRW3C_27955, partial [Escherichia coli]
RHPLFGPCANSGSVNLEMFSYFLLTYKTSFINHNVTLTAWLNINQVVVVSPSRKNVINSENVRGRRPVTGPHAGKDPQKKPDFSGLVSDGFQYAIDVAVIALVCAIVPPAYRASG